MALIQTSHPAGSTSLSGIILASPEVGRGFGCAWRGARVESAGLVCLLALASCGNGSKRAQDDAEAQRPPAGTSAAAAPPRPPPAKVVTPVRLTQLAVSAYSTSLAIDDEAVYLMTENAAYRLVDGEPAQGIRLELGTGPVLTHSAFIYWSKGRIWSAPKQGGVPRELAKFAHQPQYFVTSGEATAWVDQPEPGSYAIHALDGKKARLLTSSTGELRALNMIGDSVYFVQRHVAGAWRIGVVSIDGAPARYGPEQKGRAPAQLAGSDALYYYDLDKARTTQLALDLGAEAIGVQNLVCSPIHVSQRIYCGCVEGIFEISKETHRPKVLAANRPGSITAVISNAERLAWTVDLGGDQLAVDMLPASSSDDAGLP
jgi:hypothetical protein